MIKSIKEVWEKIEYVKGRSFFKERLKNICVSNEIIEWYGMDIMNECTNLYIRCFFLREKEYTIIVFFDGNIWHN